MPVTELVNRHTEMKKPRQSNCIAKEYSSDWRGDFFVKNKLGFLLKLTKIKFNWSIRIICITNNYTIIFRQ